MKWVAYWKNSENRVVEIVGWLWMEDMLDWGDRWSEDTFA